MNTGDGCPPTRSLFPQSLYLFRGARNDELVPSDQGGLIRTKDEFQQIVAAVNRFYDNTTPEQIEEHNRLQVEHYRNPPPPNAPVQTKPGYVYVLKAETGQFKIGQSKSPAKRMEAIGTKLPCETEVICVIPSEDPKTLERALHTRFAAKRVRGEWFELSPADIEAIKSEHL
jgi:hypothetical protein